MFNEDLGAGCFVVCAQSQVRAAPLWWIELETRRAIIAPPIWKQGRCGEPDLAEALIDPHHCDSRTRRSLSPVERTVLSGAHQLIEAVENGVPLVLTSRAIGSAFVAVSPTYRLDTNPSWADIYGSLRVAGQSFDDWEIAAELSCGFDVERWARLPVGGLDAQFVCEAFSYDNARMIGVNSKSFRKLRALSKNKTDGGSAKQNQENESHISDPELPFLALVTVRRRYPDLSWRLICPPALGIVYAIGFDLEGRPVASLRYGRQGTGLSDLLAERIYGFAPIDIVAGRGQRPADIRKHSIWIDLD
jgi:hypothetical protein